MDRNRCRVPAERSYSGRSRGEEGREGTGHQFNTVWFDSSPGDSLVYRSLPSVQGYRAQRKSRAKITSSSSFASASDNAGTPANLPTEENPTPQSPTSPRTQRHDLPLTVPMPAPTSIAPPPYASRFKHLTLSFPSENVLHVELERCSFFFFSKLRHLSFLLIRTPIRPPVNAFNEE